MAEKKKKKFSLTPFSIILILLVLVAVITMFCNGMDTGTTVDVTETLLWKDNITQVLPESETALEALKEAGWQEITIVTGSEAVLVSGAGLPNILMSVANGFANAMEVIIFVFILGGFLGLVAHSGALETGIAVLVKALKGKELVIIPVLMAVFSICGSTYGMLEESVGFYALLSGTMVAAGMDTIVASAIVLLGAGSGVLGSTVNPFAVGAAQGAANDAFEALGVNYTVNMGTMIAIGAILWVIALSISIFFVFTYAKKVKADKGSTILSLQEQEAMVAEYGNKDLTEDVKLTGRQKAILILFGVTFLVMILMFIPWFDLIPSLEYDWDNMAVVKGGAIGWTEYIFGVPFGVTYMLEAATWFLIMGIIIGIVDMAGREEHAEAKIVDTFIAGCTDMMSVCLIIAVSRGVSVLMSETNFSAFLVHKVGGALEGLHPAVFTPLNYLFHIVLSVLVPSSSGIAALSGGVMAPIANGAEKSVEVTLMTMVAANGLVNLITPTCGAIMGGLALAKVDYSTWVKWAAKVVGCIGVASLVLLTIWGLF